MPYCSNCEREVSSRASVCPKCGEPDPAPATTEDHPLLWIGFLVFLMIGMFGLWWSVFTVGPPRDVVGDPLGIAMMLIVFSAVTVLIVIGLVRAIRDM